MTLTLADRLSQIQTRWSLVLDAHGSEIDKAALAQAQLAQRYLGAIYRYLLGAVHDPHLADDLTQDFAVRLCRGDFHRANPDRGRFRDFIKTAASNMVTDHWRKRKPIPMPENTPEPPAPDPPIGTAFEDGWREELLNRTWEALAASDRSNGQSFYAILRMKADHPEWRAAKIAEQLGRQTGKPMTEEAVRKALQRARSKFADLLLAEVARSIRSSAREDVEEELRDLNLWVYCQPALERSTTDE